MTEKLWQKLKYLENKRAFKIAFFIIIKGLSIKQIAQLFLEDENPTLINMSKVINHTMRMSMWQLETQLFAYSYI